MKKSNEPREYTPEEVRDMFIYKVKDTIECRQKLEGTLGDQMTVDQRIAGVAFSILAILDGSDPYLPGFSVIPSPHQDDKQYNIEKGQNYFPESSEVKCDISGNLHNLLTQ